MPTYLIGIDNGGTMTKAILFDTKGKEIGVASRKTEMLFPHPDWTERNTDEMWRATAACIRELITSTGINPADIAGIAATGHGNGLYLVDEQGNPARNGIISTDTRAKDYIDRWYSDGTFRKQLPKTMQSIWAGQPAAILAWMKDNEPETYKNFRWAFLCKDYICFRLTGEAWSEVTDMSGSSLMNTRDVCYDEEVLKNWGIGEIFSRLAPICTSSDVRGHVTATAAGETGLVEGTPVVGGMMDIHAAAVATGVLDDSRLCVIAGTWSINEYVSTKPVVSDDLFMTSLFCTPGTWLTTEASPTSASNLEWFVTQFMGEERIDEAETGKSVFECANELVGSIAPDASHVIFVPFLYGSNVDAYAKASFIGMAGWHTKAHVLRAIYEGVAFCHRAHIEKLLKHGATPKTARIAGGAAKSKVWVQMFADVLQIPMESVSGTELSAIGAAIAAGVGTGHFDSFEMRSLVHVEHSCQPDLAKKAIYDEKYALYKATIEALTPVWRKM